MLGIAEAAARLGVHEAAFRGWLARTPGHRIGRRVGHAYQLDQRDLFVCALWAVLIRHGIGPPATALRVARQVAGHRGPTVYVLRQPDGEAVVASEPPTAPSVAIPTQQIWDGLAVQKD